MLFLPLALVLPAAEFHLVTPKGASATSFLEDGESRFDQNYLAFYALDGDPKTAWVEGVKGNGEGQVLTLMLPPDVVGKHMKIEIWNGLQASAALLAANAAPKDVHIEVKGATVAGAKDVTLEKKMGPQAFTLELQEQWVSFVTIKIVSTWPGKKYSDTCISDVAVSFDGKLPAEFAADEAERVKQIHEDAQRHARAAKFFQAPVPANYPFAGRTWQAGKPAKARDGELARVLEKIDGAKSLADNTFSDTQFLDACLGAKHTIGDVTHSGPEFGPAGGDELFMDSAMPILAKNDVVATPRAGPPSHGVMYLAPADAAVARLAYWDEERGLIIDGPAEQGCLFYGADGSLLVSVNRYDRGAMETAVVVRDDKKRISGLDVYRDDTVTHYALH